MKMLYMSFIVKFIVANNIGDSVLYLYIIKVNIKLC